jgi:hypothetical protein
MRSLINNKLRVTWKPRPSVRPRVCDPVSADYHEYITNSRQARLNSVKIGAVSFMQIQGVKEFLDVISIHLKRYE